MQMNETQKTDSTFEIVNDKKARKVIDRFVDMGYEVTKSGLFKDNFVWTEKDYRDEIRLNVGKVDVSENVKEKRNIRDSVVFGVETNTSTGKTTFYTVELESETHIGYIIFKVKDGIFLNKSKTQFNREVNNEVVLCEVGWTSKKSYEHWGEYRTHTQTSWNQLVRQSDRMNGGKMFCLKR